MSSYPPTAIQPSPPERARAASLRFSGNAEPFIVMLLVLLFCIYAGYRNADFWSALNWQLLLQPLAEAGLVSIGMMFVIATGGIDLSAGSIVGVAAVMMGIGTHHGWPVWGMEFAALATGAACGAFNGVLIGWLRLSPILATLGTMILFSGLGLAVSSGASFAGFPDGLLWWNDATLLGIPVEFLVFVVVIALAAVLLHATLWGRYVIAIGSNHEAARYSGYPVRLSLFAVYSFQGLLCGGAAVLLTARLASARADMGQGLMLMAVAAVVLGGAPIAGGSASVLGTVTGVSAFYIVQNGLLLLGVPAFVQYALTSALLLVAVGLGNLLRGRGEEER